MIFMTIIICVVNTIGPPLTIAASANRLYSDCVYLRKSLNERELLLHLPIYDVRLSTDLTLFLAFLKIVSSDLDRRL